MASSDPMIIDAALVGRLIARQFPQWAHLPVRPVKNGGRDNATFHLGEAMSVRLPIDAAHALQARKEQHWLPILGPALPLPIPTPLAVGEPDLDYPWTWGVYGWIAGEAATPRLDLTRLAADLANFLLALQRIDPSEGPPPGAHNFHRGGPPVTYDAETRRAIRRLGDRIDTAKVAEVWDAALAAERRAAPVWIHGDVAAGNLLVRDGRLAAVIDFGIMGVGDPACDLVIAWTFLDGPGREAFRTALPYDPGTWARARGWALWKALITVAGRALEGSEEAALSWRVLGLVLEDHRRHGVARTAV